MAIRAPTLLLQMPAYFTAMLLLITTHAPITSLHLADGLT
jgi:hypothetical protein